ncbi:MAG TPA: ABC transporter ATP-binding protein [Pseudonocardiaceae bacterium]|jgi:ABC-2 type transport system ATP-binding protein|nr:ABC transporter ATP-binding protein [Pseudonocardiaceae bacterium]
MPASIEVDRLVKRYRKASTNAVDSVSFDVPEGSLFCLLGPNGAGKTTTVAILTTTLRPTSGRVVIAGRDLATDRSAVRRELGVVFQQPSLDLNLTAEENVRLHAVVYRLYPWRPTRASMPAAYRRQVSELAGLLGIADVLGRPARVLSGGMRRKLEILRALLHRPRVLFLDEPTAGLDPESRRDLWSYLSQVRNRYGTTVFLTTHYLEEAESADAVCVLAGGRIVEHGTPAQLKSRHTRPELLLDADDRPALRRELIGLGLAVTGDAPLRVPLAEPVAATAQQVIQRVGSTLTRCQVVAPTLEDTYLTLLRRMSGDG